MNSDKKIKIAFRDEDEYLWVSISGPWNVSVLEEYIIEIRQRLAKSGCKHVLIDAQELIHPRGASFDRYKVGEIIAREWGPYIKSAVITKSENISRYAEIIAVKRGAHFRVFSNMEAAKNWLLS